MVGWAGQGLGEGAEGIEGGADGGLSGLGTHGKVDEGRKNLNLSLSEQGDGGRGEEEGGKREGEGG